jgi:hypothetical protein
MAIPFLSGSTRDKKELHKVVIQAKNYPYYAVKKVYEDVGSVVGVSLVKPADDLESEFNLKTFLRDGRVRFVKVSDEDGNVYRLICAGDDVVKALANVRKKKINSKAINTAWIPGRISFR